MFDVPIYVYIFVLVMEAPFLDEKYRATKLWNDVIRAFRAYMPLRKHWKQLKPYDDSFTGREAIDFITCYSASKYLKDKISREQAVFLLGQFHRKGLFEDVINEFAPFKYNGLYRFCDLTSKEIAETPLAAKIQSRLRSSVRETSYAESNCSPFSPKQPVEQSRPVTTLSYRRFGSFENVDSKNGIPRTIINPCFGHRSPKAERNLSPRSNVENINSQNEFRKIKICRTVSCEEVEKLWKVTISQKFNGIVEDYGICGLDNLPCEANLQWNAATFSSNAICKVSDRKDDFPHWVLEAMKCLGNWPWYKGSFQPAIYTGFERDAFYSLLDYLRETRCILPEAFQRKILEIFDSMVKFSPNGAQGSDHSIVCNRDGIVSNSLDLSDIKFVDDDVVANDVCARPRKELDSPRVSQLEMLPGYRKVTEFSSTSSPVTRLVAASKSRPQSSEMFNNRISRPKSCLIAEPSNLFDTNISGSGSFSSLDFQKKSSSVGQFDDFLDDGKLVSQKSAEVSPLGMFERGSASKGNNVGVQTENHSIGGSRTRASWALASVSRTIRSSLRKLSKSSQSVNETDAITLCGGIICENKHSISNKSDQGKFVITSVPFSLPSNSTIIHVPFHKKIDTDGDVDKHKDLFPRSEVFLTGEKSTDIQRNDSTTSGQSMLNETFVVADLNDGDHSAVKENLEIIHIDPADRLPRQCFETSENCVDERIDDFTLVANQSNKCAGADDDKNISRSDICMRQLTNAVENIQDACVSECSGFGIDDCSEQSQSANSDTLSILKSLPGLRTTPELLEKLRISNSPSAAEVVAEGTSVTFRQSSEFHNPNKLTYDGSSETLETPAGLSQQNVTPFARGAVQYRSTGGAAIAARRSGKRNSHLGVLHHDDQFRPRNSYQPSTSSRRYPPPSSSSGFRHLRQQQRTRPPLGPLLPDGPRSSIKCGVRGCSRIPPYASCSRDMPRTRAILQARAQCSRFSIASNIFDDCDENGLFPNNSFVCSSYVSPECVDEFAESLHLLLLTLPAGSRRRLQLILRLIYKVSSNRLLHLDNLLRNDIVFIEALAGIIFPLGEKAVGRDRLCQLVRLMVVKNEALFKKPLELIKCVDEEVSRLKTERIVIESNPEAQAVTFCDRVTSAEYDKQCAKVSSEHLMRLLDALIDDENMKPIQKKKRLQRFAKSYPDLFKARFPSDYSFQALFPPKPSSLHFNLLKKLRM